MDVNVYNPISLKIENDDFNSLLRQWSFMSGDLKVTEEEFKIVCEELSKTHNLDLTEYLPIGARGWVSKSDYVIVKLFIELLDESLYVKGYEIRYDNNHALIYEYHIRHQLRWVIVEDFLLDKPIPLDLLEERISTSICEYGILRSLSNSTYVFHLGTKENVQQFLSDVRQDTKLLQLE